MDIEEKVLLAEKNIKTLKLMVEESGMTLKAILKDPHTDYQLKLWAGTQKRLIATGALSDGEVEIYRSNGFDFGIEPLMWDEWYQLVKEYCETHKVEKIPAHTVTRDGYVLDVWLNRQINNRKKLEPGQLENINAIYHPKPSSYVIEYKGQTFPSAKAFTEATDTPYGVVCAFAKMGLNGEEIISFFKTNSYSLLTGGKITFKGHSFKNLVDFSNHYDIGTYAWPWSYVLAVQEANNGSEANKPVGYNAIQKPVYEELNPEIKEKLDFYRVPYSFAVKRIREGMAVSEVLKEYWEIESEKAIQKYKQPYIEICCERYRFTNTREFADYYEISYDYAVKYLAMGFKPKDVVKYYRERVKKEQREKESALRKEKEYIFFYKGEGYSSYHEFSELYDIPYHRLRLLLKEGFGLDQIIEINERGYRRGITKSSVIEFEGHIYFDAYDFSSHYGVSYIPTVLKLKAGHSCDEIVQSDDSSDSAVDCEGIFKTDSIEKWETSKSKDDRLLLAYAYCEGLGRKINLKRAVEILYRIKDYAPAKLLLARCYLRQYDRKVLKAKWAIHLLMEYNNETIGNRNTYKDDPTGILKSIVPDLVKAYSILLSDDKSDTAVLESIKYYAEALNDESAQEILFRYYSDVFNFFYDIEEAKKYENMINDRHEIEAIYKEYLNCLRTDREKEGEDMLRLFAVYAYPHSFENLPAKKKKSVLKRVSKELDLIDSDWDFLDDRPFIYLEDIANGNEMDTIDIDYRDNGILAMERISLQLKSTSWPLFEEK